MLTLSEQGNYLTMQSVWNLLLSLLSFISWCVSQLVSHASPAWQRSTTDCERIATTHDNVQTQPCCNGPDEPDDSCVFSSLWSPLCPFCPNKNHKAYSISLFLSIPFLVEWYPSLTNTPLSSFSSFFLALSDQDRSVWPGHDEGERIWDVSQPECLCCCYCTPKSPNSPT